MCRPKDGWRGLWLSPWCSPFFSPHVCYTLFVLGSAVGVIIPDTVTESERAKFDRILTTLTSTLLSVSN